MEFWLELLKATQLAGSDGAVIGKLFNNDQINMNFSVAAGLSSLKTFSPKYYPQMRSVPPPWTGNKAIERLHPMFVNNKSKYIEEATALIKFIVSPKNLWYLTTTNGYPYVPYTNFGKIVPAYSKYLDTIWLQGYEKTNYIGEFELLGEYTFAYAELGQIIDSNLEKAIGGSVTITQALQDRPGSSHGRAASWHGLRTNCLDKVFSCGPPRGAVPDCWGTVLSAAY